MGSALHTKKKIISVAEILFAEKGFKETSLRTITGQAKVNLASVNYHFGDKKNLIRAVVDKYLEAFMPAVGEELLLLEGKDEVSMEEVFSALKKPLVQLDDVAPNGTERFLQLIGRGYAEVQGHLRWFITTRYGDVLDRFIAQVSRANPELDRETLFWRLHFTLGTCVFTMASSEALIDIANSEFEPKQHVERIFDQIVPYLASGMNAK
ncbi:transcriptional regulator for fatty acid degradation fadQ, tetR family [Vibrio ishigakensis]|uniref:Transcriptional regulator for fatty acid degradation fadQ, tetR family n=1 Tax=Vibrio ishigakensis TaxID=1481914 RepID=A0A0B8P1W3_9VIBR|nr:TetR/AcrR family transcriptional regulator [Vibrio ishigakensis]GAM56919.1 transcriptional regulator for fatty acid degradation fadQ, tetR family [Vibrio ishigakensis]